MAGVIVAGSGGAGGVVTEVDAGGPGSIVADTLLGDSRSNSLHYG
ncbi:hypothetical protein RJG79_08595 [Mycoplasmatota bacterium WC44]